jgi:tetrapyrrole methylase family protein/MazG family protein
MITITLIGLGTSDQESLTYVAGAKLQHLTTCFTPVPDHPALALVAPKPIKQLPLDDAHAAAMQLVEQASACGDGGEIVCALPGHPSESPIFTALHRLLANDVGNNQQGSIAIAVIAGVSMLDSIRARLGWTTTTSQVQIGHTSMLLPPKPTSSTAAAKESNTETEAKDDPAWCEMHGKAHYTPPLLPYPFNPSLPLLLWLEDSVPLELVQPSLLLRYPANSPVHRLTMDTTGQMVVSGDVALGELANMDQKANPRAIALAIDPLPPVANSRSFTGLMLVAARLLGPAGCPWDRKQTFLSLRRELLEETYEVLEALDTEDMAMLSEELGDLLLQVVMQSEMARQAGLFSIEQVIDQISTKLIRRHPHVFADVQVANTSEVLHNWEQIKAQELREKGRARSSILDGVPPALPALAAAQKTITKAIRAGFTWESLDGVWHKLNEEINELREAIAANEQQPSQAHRDHIAAELGDVLFVLVTLAHWQHIEAESSLRDTLQTFRQRFHGLERIQQERGITLPAMGQEDLLALWQEAKRMNG